MSEIGEKIGLSTAESKVVCNVVMKKKILDEFGFNPFLPPPPGTKGNCINQSCILKSQILGPQTVAKLKSKFQVGPRSVEATSCSHPQETGEG